MAVCTRRWKLNKSLILSVTMVFAAALLSGFSIANAADLAAAEANYQGFCLKCHGVDGKGDGPAAAILSKKPQDYTDCAYMAKQSDEKLFNVIKNGGAANGLGPDMQAWKDAFEDNEIRDLVAYVRTFCKK